MQRQDQSSVESFAKSKEKKGLKRKRVEGQFDFNIGLYPDPKRQKIGQTESFSSAALSKLPAGFVETIKPYSELKKEFLTLNLVYPNLTPVPETDAGQPVMIKSLSSVSFEKASSTRSISYYWVLGLDGQQEQVFKKSSIGTGFYYAHSYQRVPADARYIHVFQNKYQKHYATNTRGEYELVGSSCQLANKVQKQNGVSALTTAAPLLEVEPSSKDKLYLVGEKIPVEKTASRPSLGSITRHSHSFFQASQPEVEGSNDHLAKMRISFLLNN